MTFFFLCAASVIAATVGKAPHWCLSLLDEEVEALEKGMVCLSQPNSTSFRHEGLAWWIWANHARHTVDPRSYADLSQLSGTDLSPGYFLKECMSWNEINPRAHELNRGSSSWLEVHIEVLIIDNHAMPLSLAGIINAGAEIVLCMFCDESTVQKFAQAQYLPLIDQGLGLDTIVFQRHGHSLGVTQEGYNIIPYPKAIFRRNIRCSKISTSILKYAYPVQTLVRPSGSPKIGAEEFFPI